MKYIETINIDIDGDTYIINIEQDIIWNNIYWCTVYDNNFLEDGEICKIRFCWRGICECRVYFQSLENQGGYEIWGSNLISLGMLYKYLNNYFIEKIYKESDYLYVDIDYDSVTHNQASQI